MTQPDYPNNRLEKYFERMAQSPLGNVVSDTGADLSQQSIFNDLVELQTENAELKKKLESNSQTIAIALIATVASITVAITTLFNIVVYRQKEYLKEEVEQGRVRVQVLQYQVRKRAEEIEVLNAELREGYLASQSSAPLVSEPYGNYPNNK